MLVSEKFSFEKGIYSPKIQHTLNLTHFPLIVKENYQKNIQMYIILKKNKSVLHKKDIKPWF